MPGNEVEVVSATPERIALAKDERRQRAIERNARAGLVRARGFRV